MRKTVVKMFAIIPVAVLFATLSIISGCGAGEKQIPMPRVENALIGGSMAYDGKYFWATQVPRLSHVEEDRKIIKFDDSGTLISSFTPEENFHDITYDGQHLWTATVFGWETGRHYGEHGYFYTIDPETGELTAQFMISQVYDWLEGLTAGEDRLWAAVQIEREMFLFEIDIELGTVMNTIQLPDISVIAIAYAKNHLWVVAGFLKHSIIKMNPHTGEIIKEYDYPGRVLNGIVAVDNDIFLVDGEKNMLFRHEE